MKISHQGNAYKTTMKYYFILTKLAIIKKMDGNNILFSSILGEDV